MADRTHRSHASRTSDASKTFPLEELSLPTRVAIPEMFRKHRVHHGELDPQSIDLKSDIKHFTELRISRRELLVHVLSQLMYASTTIHTQLPEFYRIARGRTQGSESDIHTNILKDVGFIIGMCRRYLKDVCHTDQIPPEALTPSFIKLIDRTLLPLFQHFADTEGQTGNVKAEVQLRTAYHIVVEGMGAGSAIQGVNLVLNQLRTARQSLVRPEATEMLSGLGEIFQAINFIERRNIAYGLFCLNRLGLGFDYFRTSKTMFDTYEQLKPILSASQWETFSRWERFPANINRAELEKHSRHRVRGWVRRLLVPGFGYKSARSLESML